VKRPEEALQRSVVQWLRLKHPRLLWFAVPNQRGTRSLIENQILKGLGVRAGVADLVFILASGQAAFIELKAPGGKQSLAQEQFEMDATQTGALYEVCDNLDRVIETLHGWMQ
jgi:ribosomal protein S10